MGLLIHVVHQLRALDRYADEIEEVAQTSQARAATDFLTGLPNRRGLTDAVRLALAASPGPAAVLFIDLDHFEVVNDTLGHDAGDDLLRQVAEAITGAVRSRDVVGRWGGDEFVVVCPTTTPSAAEEVADRIRRALLIVTPASVGCADLDVDSSACLGDAINKADAAMFSEKQRSRARSHGLTAPALGA